MVNCICLCIATLRRIKLYIRPPPNAIPGYAYAVCACTLYNGAHNGWAATHPPHATQKTEWLALTSHIPHYPSVRRSSLLFSLPNVATRNVLYTVNKFLLWVRGSPRIGRDTFINLYLHHNAAKTRSSATAEKQRVSYTWLPGLVSWPSDDHTWRYNAQNTTESQMLCYFLTFKRSDSENAGRKRILTWKSWSKSFKVIYFAVICRPKRGGISSYNIACRISEVFEHVAS